MAGERRYIAASKFCASVRDGTHDSPKPVESGRRLVTSRHLTTGRLDLSQAYLISEVDYVAINKRSKVDRWDVLISMIGTVGEPCLIKEEPDFAIKNIGLFKTKCESDGKWLYYYLRSKDAQQSILAHSRGTTQQYIPLGALRDFPILITDDPKEQRAIAHVLGALDDMIEVNREINETLEEMARALFKSWFVDFDPVRAKLEGRPPAGMDAATAARFPDHFQDSELGQIPKGWEVGKVSDFASLGRVAVNPGNYPSELFDHYSLPAFDDGRVPKLENGDSIMSNKFLVESDAVLLSKLNPHIPRVWLPDLHASRRSVCSTEFMVARAISGATREYLFSLFTNPYFASIYDTLVSGTTGSHQRISPESFLQMQIIVPPIPLIKSFTNAVKPMFDTAHSNIHESRDLATLRDTLLPKLLSGEVSVSAAKEFIAAST